MFDIDNFRSGEISLFLLCEAFRHLKVCFDLTCENDFSGAEKPFIFSYGNHPDVVDFPWPKMLHITIQQVAGPDLNSSQKFFLLNLLLHLT